MSAQITFEETTTPMVIDRVCPFCQTHFEITVDAEKAIKWIMGELIQNVWPELTLSQREILITGTCDPCWERYM